MNERIELPRGMYIDIQIEHDTDAQDPNEDMDMATFHVFESRVDFWSFVRACGWDQAQVDEAVDGAVLQSNGVLYMGLERYRHSGDVYALCSNGNFPDRRWDVSPIVGFISPHPEVDKGVIEEFRKLHNEERITETKELLMKRLNQAIATYNHYLAGEVYGFTDTMYDAGGIQIGDDESCWGFIGDEEYCLQEAKETAHRIALSVLTKEEIQKCLEGLTIGELADYVKSFSLKILNKEEQDGKPFSEIAHRLYHYITETYLKSADAHTLICRVKDGEWGEYPEFPKCDWHYEVESGYTVLGYWDWVSHMIESNQGDGL